LNPQDLQLAVIVGLLGIFVSASTVRVMTVRLGLMAFVLMACAPTSRSTSVSTPTNPQISSGSMAGTSPVTTEPESGYAVEPVPLTDDARRALVAARSDLHRNQFDDALARLRECLVRHPDDTAVRLLVARLMSEDGHNDEAVTLLREAQRRTPDDADLLTFVGGLRLRQAIDGATIERRRGSISARPSTDAAAEARQVRSWLEAARDAFADAVRARSNHIGALSGGALTASRLEAHTEAVRLWQRVVDLTHDHDAEEHLADAIALGGNRAQAIARYEALLQTEPTRATALASIASLYDAEGRHEEAQRARGKAVFYEWTAPFTIEANPENVATVETLSSWFREEETPAQSSEGNVRVALERLGTTRTSEARSLLAAFVLHHSHDDLEAVAWTALQAHGGDAADTLFQLFESAHSMCTMRSSADSLARIHDQRLFDLLARVLPRDVGIFPIDAAHALEVLGDVRAVPLLVDLIRSRRPQTDADDPVGISGFLAARSRATLALGAFDTVEARGILTQLTHDADVSLEATAALYRITHTLPLLMTLERVSVAQRSRADWILANYIDRAATPQATAAALRARRRMSAATRPPRR
jgi:cytochrome c-type biogenesis protein CcmH/NrfG